MLNYIYLITLNYLSFIFLYKLSLKYNFVDKPNSRKKHLYPTPLIGGLIIYLNLIFSIYLFEFPNQINLIIVYSGIIIVTGFLDDFPRDFLEDFCFTTSGLFERIVYINII